MQEVFFTVLSIWLIWKLFSAFSGQSSSSQRTQQQNYYQTNHHHYSQDKKEGEVKIEEIPDSAKNKKDNDGDYVDYEEIK